MCEVSEVGETSMSKVKIVSNPYHRSVTFMSLNGNSWEELTPEKNANSELIGKEITRGFFPFKARHVVDVILKEYGNGEGAAAIEFEGPDDEWLELSNVCAAPELEGRISLERGGRFLANARDILDYVRDEFDGIYPIIASQLDTRPNAKMLLDKFRDASSDRVPVCVVGNYSSGKSTFINALLGVELLPSGDKPLTSRVFRIERSGQIDRASIKVDYLGGVLDIQFGDRTTSIVTSASEGGLSRDMRTKLNESVGTPILERLRTALAMINQCKQGEELLGDLVKVSVPYAHAAWMRDKHFVIFDTPGSNSNSNAHHLSVLKEAMRGMSDGLPIFVTEFSAIDSNDNADLYDEIKAIEALDERFAMVVVNKADAADLPEGGWMNEDEDYIKSTAVVRNLYAQGVYFVSSVMGLGAKVDGGLLDRHYDRCYRQLLESYQNPDDRFYTRLYQYDLMPEQLKAKMLNDAAACSDLVYANSGLFSIECGVEDFATKYSIYNKCSCSDDLLKKLIEETDDALEEASERVADAKRLGEGELDELKSDRLNRLKEVSDELGNRMLQGYPAHMGSRDYLTESNLSMDELCDWERAFTSEQERKNRVDDRRYAADSARDATFRRLGERFSTILDSRDILGFRDLASEFVDDAYKALKAYQEVASAQSETNRFVSSDLLARIRDHFDTGLSRGMNSVAEHSKQYWEDAVNQCRAALLDLVSDGENIERDRSESLRAIIMDFRPLALDDAVPEIKDIRSPFNPDKLWKAPIFLQHNMELSRRIGRWRSAVERAHEDSFRIWLSDLTAELERNIVDLNPELRKTFDLIRKNERDLVDLQVKRDRLRRAEENVSALMAWRGEA